MMWSKFENKWNNIELKGINLQKMIDFLLFEEQNHSLSWTQEKCK